MPNTHCFEQGLHSCVFWKSHTIPFMTQNSVQVFELSRILHQARCEMDRKKNSPFSPKLLFLFILRNVYRMLTYRTYRWIEILTRPLCSVPEVAYCLFSIHKGSWIHAGYFHYGHRTTHEVGGVLETAWHSKAGKSYLPNCIWSLLRFTISEGRCFMQSKENRVAIPGVGCSSPSS